MPKVHGRLDLAAVIPLSGVLPASAASPVEITAFGQDPTHLRMHVYAPESRLVPPPILVELDKVYLTTGSDAIRNWRHTGQLSR